jgi:hypothetical protein
MNVRWYWDRLRRMEPTEVAWRFRDAILRQLWRSQQRIPIKAHGLTGRSFVGLPPVADIKGLPQSAVNELLMAAEGLLEGGWRVFAKPHPAFDTHPDWFVDARSGLRAARDQYTFDIPYRDESKIGNIKYIWEPSRHQHLTVLASGYAITRDDRYAERIALHLTSWWRENPFLCGPHWISGIELGIRLVSWIWVRRLLSAWPKAAALFEENPLFVDQLYRHQNWLASLPSRGSSANNHLIAEAAGQFAASCVFPIFAESDRWRSVSARILEEEAARQTFGSGLNRELATDYHGFVLELFLSAAIEGELSTHVLPATVWTRICAMIDALAAVVDAQGQPPHQGDSDEGVGLLLDAPSYNRWRSLLSTGRELFGPMPWWPRFEDEDVRTKLWTRGIPQQKISSPRPLIRPNLFEDAGQVYLRAGSGSEEIWCRCDAGPHGFSGIAAHAHADALSLELRVGGVEVLADPGTFCYHGNPEWREYFRSTIAHNTIELMGRSQSVSGGPFLWTEHAGVRLISVEGLEEDSPDARWQAEHMGYLRQGGPIHRRSVVLDRVAHTIMIEDDLFGDSTASTPMRMAFHFGADVKCALDSGRAILSWADGGAELQLPPYLSWSLHRGEENPPLGWFSPSFDVKLPTFCLLGSGTMVGRLQLKSNLRILKRKWT